MVNNYIIIVDENLVTNEEFLNTEFFNEICRCCLSKGHVTNILNLKFEDTSFSQIISQLFNTQVDIDDGMPQNICEACISAIIQFYSFKKMYDESKEFLQACVASKGSLQTDSEEQDLENSDDAESVIVSELKIEESDSDLDNENDTTEVVPNALHNCNSNSDKDDVDNESGIEEANILHNVNNENNLLHIADVFEKDENIDPNNKKQSYVCKICGTKISLRNNLKRHMKTHTGEKSFICNICGKGFTRNRSLIGHKRAHTGETPFLCTYCGCRYLTRLSYEIHLQKHEDYSQDSSNKLVKTARDSSQFSCHKCNKNLASRSSLKTHMLFHGEKKYLCSQCGKRFHNNATLQIHSRVHTGVKPYSCDICQRKFSQINSLKVHKSIHTGTRPFTCKICLRAFTQPAHLKTHMRIHSGERPYVCTYCKKAFSHSGTLTVHMRTHTGETPYLCDLCPRGFYDSTSLKKHRKKHLDS